MTSHDMKSKQLAIEFVKRFCEGDVEALEPLLADDFTLKGPLFQFESRAAYLDSLRSDQLERGSYRLPSVTESDDSVAVFYEYRKSEGAVTIAQLFRFKAQKISEILLVFDGREVV